MAHKKKPRASGPGMAGKKVMPAGKAATGAVDAFGSALISVFGSPAKRKEAQKAALRQAAKPKSSANRAAKAKPRRG